MSTGIPGFTLLMWGHIEVTRVVHTKGEENRIELWTALNRKSWKSKPRKSRNACTYLPENRPTWKQLKSSLQCFQHSSSVKSIQKLSPGSWSDPWFQFEHQPSVTPWTYGFDSSYSTIILSGLQNILVGAGFSQRTPSATIVPYAIFVYLWNSQP